MRVAERSFYNVSRAKEYSLYPLGDLHVGAAACDEGLLKKVIKRIGDDKHAIWVGMGDYCDFINKRDKRYDPMTTAEWCRNEADIARTQLEYTVDLLKPIAHKCIGMIEGNHEREIKIKWERDVQYELVQKIKDHGEIDPEWRMDLGFYAWINFKAYQSKQDEKPAGLSRVVINLHHGFVGGRLAGAKALNMQRWLWTHNCDLSIHGHSHSRLAQPEVVEGIDSAGNWFEHVRKGAFSGTFLRTVQLEGASTYSEVKDIFPLLSAGIFVFCDLRPKTNMIESKLWYKCFIN
jgi:hypothetical protein